MTIKDAIRWLEEARILERAAIEQLEMAKSSVIQAEEAVKDARKKGHASRHAVMVLACLVVAAPAFAQNPCTETLPHQILPASGANRFHAILPAQSATLPDGTPIVVSYQYAAWNEGTDPNAGAPPPTQGPSTIPKGAFVPVAGFANCYELTGGLPALMPTQARTIAGLRSVGQPNATPPQSAWSASNSFSLASTP